MENREHMRVGRDRKSCRELVVCGYVNAMVLARYSFFFGGGGVTFMGR